MILVYVEIEHDHASEVSLETVTFARRLSEAGGGVPIDAVVAAAVSAPVATEVAGELAAYGVRAVLQAGSADFELFSGSATARAAIAARDAQGSVVVMAGGTNRGNEVMARVATRLGVPMAANVVDFAGLSPFVVTRQVVGGAALEEMQLAQRPAVFTVAGHAVEPAPAQSPAAGELTALPVELTSEDLAVRVVSVERAGTDDADSLKSARVVVGAGRGVGGPDGFSGVLELAELLGGSLGVSRVVTSLGWRPHHEQVGQTGSRIAPEVYIPCGISGAIQHWAGCASSKVILAINTDPEAPMMTKATYAVVGDMHEVVPAINEEIRRRRG
jgi:electron transfer flavoprotein alpha subunit